MSPIRATMVGIPSLMAAGLVAVSVVCGINGDWTNMGITAGLSLIPGVGAVALNKLISQDEAQDRAQATARQADRQRMYHYLNGLPEAVEEGEDDWSQKDGIPLSTSRTNIVATEIFTHT